MNYQAFKWPTSGGNWLLSPNGTLSMLDRFLTSVAAFLCRHFGHCDDVHDTGLVRVRVCFHCRSLRVENYSGRRVSVFAFADCDSAGKPLRAPRTVLVREE